MSTGEERRIYELRLEIESDMYQLVDLGFGIDDLQEFMEGVIADIEDREDEEEAEESG